MLATSSSPHDTLTVIPVLVVIAACLCVIYWRTALRVIVIFAIVLALTGTMVIIYGLASLMAAHHGG
jgi:hypothetical protein